MTKTWWETPMGGSVLSFLKAEWKVSDTGSAHSASSFYMHSSSCDMVNKCGITN
jgi:hypothetical protein